MTVERTAVKLTLNRWHKVQARLQSELNAASAEAAASFSAVAIDPSKVADDTGVKLTIADRVAAGEAALAKVELLSGTIEVVRAKLGEVNGSFGISALLAKAENLNRQIATLRKILGLYDANAVRVENVKFGVPSTDYSSGRVAFNVLTKDAHAALRAELEALVEKSHKLADELSDLNQKKVSIEIAVVAAKAAGVN